MSDNNRILDINEPDHSGNREYAGGICPMCEQPLQGGADKCTH